jgi:hypothetical protein
LTGSAPHGSVSITQFGAVGDGKTDNQAAIQKALDYAHAHGLSVFVPQGVFNHSGTLSANGVTVFGVGTGSVLHGTDPSHEALHLHGGNTAVSGVELTTDAGDRQATGDAAAIYVDHVRNFTILNVTIDTTAGPASLSTVPTTGRSSTTPCRTPTRSRSA